MKVLLVSPLSPPAGGIATWTELYLRSEQSKLNHVDVVNTAVCGNRISNLNKRNFFEEIKRIIKILSETESYLKTGKYDIIHINTSCSKFGMLRDYFCVKKVKNKKTKIIIHFHCDTNYMIKDKFSEWIFKKLCKEGNKLLCLNTFSQKHIKKLTNKESIIIPNFINNEIVKNLGEMKITDKIKKIIYVGHITKAKGCDDIITVAREMPNINFKLVGYLSKEIKDIKITRNVEFLGELTRDEVLKIMIQADLLLFPSHTEGFPNALLEAMACGLPIVATKVGAIPDMIENKGGVLVDIGDDEGIIKALNILHNPVLRQQISRWNKEKVLYHYTTDTVMEQIFKIYNK